MKDYYKILGVPRSESIDGIRAAFRNLAKKHHPDKRGAEETRNFQEITEAYSVLSDPESRKRYNEKLKESENLRRAGPRWKDPPTVRRSVEHDVTLPAAGLSEWFSDIFDEVFHDLFEFGFSGPCSRSVREAELVLSREEAERGGDLSVPVARSCPVCGGTGRRGGYWCPRCAGAGEVESDRTIRVRIPAGVRNGAVLQLSVEVPQGRPLNLRLHVRVS
ncbi:DnaJ domain-containing protein [Desulfoglaeba alkanexedens]|jgi:DnaJ-class molecular chaperone|uniref:J domain-containing protein n=1 Tax=Desulfoglaeba alkanexedens ALDC TaxID=980445 RepID=A0A4P8L6T8_9BACT|nr:DnaJ domain-containing protein [Desulfoglaeba alkanexedens]QCQ22845.1 J domain-containing protein [Desulfoglaeba alkanexedens ALDC]